MITIAQPAIEADEIAAVNKVLTSGQLSQGPRVAELEKAFAKYCGTQYAVAVNSGTAALHSALFAAGVGPGDEVITTPFSFIATINPILMLGAKPVLVDIDPISFNLNPSLVKAAITKKTKAIIAVHLYGQVIDWPALEQATEHHPAIAIIEDACQAIGARHSNKKVGSLGTLGCFSFYATKNIMCGEGGMVTTNDQALAQSLQRFRQHGMSSSYQYEHLGFNYRLTDLLATIAHQQLKKVDRFNASRQQNASDLSQLLSDTKGLILPVVPANQAHVFNQYTVRVTADFPLTRDELVAKLHRRGIAAGVYYPKPLHLVPHIAVAGGFKTGDFPEAEQAAQQVLSLPIHPKVSPTDLKTMAKAIKDISRGL